MKIPKSLTDYAEYLLEAHASAEREELITPRGERVEALRVSGSPHFVKLMRDFLASEGIICQEDFRTMDQDDAKTLGSLANLRAMFNEDAVRRRDARKQMEDDRSETLRIRAEDSTRFAGLPKIDPELKRKLLEELRNRPKAKDPRRAGMEAAARVRLIMDARRIESGDR